MKLKNVLLSVMSLALVAVIAIGGTLAYLTDRDSEVNVFTIGNVSIDLTEDFDQGAELIPGVKIEKEARITNTGDNAAWVWMTMAIPAALDSNNTDTVGEVNALHWNVPGVVWKGYGDNTSWATADKVQTALSNGYITEDHIDEETGLVKADCLWTICQTADAPVAIKQETIDNVAYNVYTFLYNGQLAADATTPVALHRVYLDESIDIDTDGQWYSVKNGEATKIEWNSNTNGYPMVYVSAYAIQADGFKTVEEAYNAYNTQWGDNGNEYGDAPAVVSDADALADAVAAGGDAVLSESVSSTTTATGYGQADIKVNGGTLDGNGYTLSVDGSGDYSAVSTTGGTIQNLNIDNGFRAVFLENMTEDVYLKNMKIGGEGVCYAINTGSNTGEYSLIVDSCEIKGWSSFSQIKSASFTNCTFAQGEYYNNVYGRLVKPYVDTVFENCEFNSKFYIDLSAFEGTQIVLKNCTVNGVKLTAENYTNLIVAENVCGEGQITIESKSGTYDVADWIDYVTIE